MSLPTSVAASWPSVTDDQNRSMGRARAADFGTRIVLTWRSFGLIGSGKAWLVLVLHGRGNLLGRDGAPLSHANGSALAGCAKSAVLNGGLGRPVRLGQRS